MVSWVLTSGCTRTVTACWPVVLMLLGSSIRRRSRSGPPAAVTAAATSAGGDPPDSRGPPPHPRPPPPGGSRHPDSEPGEATGHGLRLLVRAHLTGGPRAAEGLDLLLGTAGGHDGQAAGQEVVAAVAALDLDGVAGGPETGDLLRQDQLHRRHDQRAVEV